MEAQPPANKRHLIYSLRNLKPTLAQATNFEFEDAIAAFDCGDIIAPHHKPARPGRAMRHVRRWVDAAIPAPAQDAPYDLFFFACESLYDLQLLGSMRQWRQRCRKTVCWINEVWAQSLHHRPGELQILEEFDHVFFHFQASTNPVSKIIGKPVDHLPSAVDTLRFCPVPKGPARTIDLFNMGRRSAPMHLAMQQLARDRELFYLYGIIQSSDKIQVKEQRSQLTDLIQRSRYFVVNKAKVDQDTQTLGQEELAFRFFEGAAAGAVMIGTIPQCSAFQEYFNWPDAVIPIEPDGSDVASVISALESDPARISRISRDNITHSLRRHDWVHRWQAILEHLGMAPSEAMTSRQEKLNTLAAQYHSVS